MAKHRLETRTRWVPGGRELTRSWRRTTLAGVGALAAVSSPLAVATPAQAAEDPVWNRLAECESGQNWQTNTGNGYYGGLQFSQETWNDYGGWKWGDRADEATRAEQVFVAEKVLDERGWSAWPSCRDQQNLGPKDAQGNPNSSPRHDSDGNDTADR